MPHCLFGQQPYAREFSNRYQLPLAASLLGGVTMYPELSARLRTVKDAEANELLSPARGRPSETSKATDAEPRDGNIHIWPIRDNVYVLLGDSGNIVVQTEHTGEAALGSAGRIRVCRDRSSCSRRHAA